MNSEQSVLRVGFVHFEDPTLLILGNSESLLWLADQLSARQVITIESGNGTSITKLRFFPISEGGRLTRQNGEFEWKISVHETEHVSQQLKALAASEVPAHAYLNPSSNEVGVDVVVSIGEYNSDRIFS